MLWGFMLSGELMVITVGDILLVVIKFWEYCFKKTAWFILHLLHVFYKIHVIYIYRTYFTVIYFYKYFLQTSFFQCYVLHIKIS